MMQTQLPPTVIGPCASFANSDIVLGCRQNSKTALLFSNRYRSEEDACNYTDDCYTGSTYDNWRDGSTAAIFPSPTQSWRSHQSVFAQFDRMKRAYAAIASSEPGQHPRVQSYHGTQHQTGFPIVQWAPKGRLPDFLAQNPQPTVPRGEGSSSPYAIKLRWALHLASALSFLHKKDIIYDGLSPSKLLVQDDLSLILADLTSAHPDSELGAGTNSAIYLIPPPYSSFSKRRDQSTWRTPLYDTYACGSILYFIMMEQEPRFVRKANPVFPDLDKVPVIGHVIRKCWDMYYGSATMMLRDIRDAAKALGLDVVGQDDIRLHESVRELDAEVLP